MKKNITINSFASLKAAVEANKTVTLNTNTITANGATEMKVTTVTPNQTIANTTIGVKTMTEKKPMYLARVSKIDLDTLKFIASDELTLKAYASVKGYKKVEQFKKTVDLILSFYANVTECISFVNSNEINNLDNSGPGVEYTLDTPIVAESNNVETIEEEVIEMVDYEDVEVPVGYEDEEEYSLEEYQEFINSSFDVKVEPELPTELSEIKGMVKANLSTKQLEEQSAVAFIDKVISYATVLWHIQKYVDMTYYVDGMNPWTSILQALKKFIENDLTVSNPRAVKAWEIAKESEVLKLKFSGASKYLKGDGINYILGNKMFTKAQTFAKYSSNGFVVDVQPKSWVAKNYSVSNTTTLVVNTKSIDKEGIKAFSKIVLLTSNGPVKFKTQLLENSLDTVSGYIGLFEAMYIAKVAKVDIKSLLASEDAHIIVCQTVNGNVYVPVDPAKAVISYGLANFFGPSNPDTIKKGILKSNQNYTGFAEFNGEGYTTIEKSAKKLVVRAVKLDKTSKHQMVLDTVYAVVDTMGNPFAVKALSTGIIHVPTSVAEKHGQVRLVSSADRGGYKATFSPVHYISSEYDTKGITFASFGSMKAKDYGIAQLLGISLEEYNNIINEYTKVVDFWGHPVKVVELSNVVLDITNHYTVQEYVPTNRNKLVMSLAEANANILERAEERASTIQEDTVFVDYVLGLRDTVYNGSLMDTIEALLKKGEIKPKGKKVSITASEYDILATTHGVAKAKEWMDSIIADNLDNNKKREDIFRAVRISTNTQAKDKRHIDVDAVTFFNTLVSIMRENGVDTNTQVSAFTSRNFLVDVATKMFDSNNNQTMWVRVYLGDKEVFIPTGNFMYGNFAETSTIYDMKVQVEGFLSSFFKVATYITKYISEHPTENLYTSRVFMNAFSQFVFNLSMELQAYTLGKKLGKMKVDGVSAVLSVCWWSEAIDTVYYMGKHKFNTKGKQAVLVKHPELFAESITGVNVKGYMPKSITKDMDERTAKVLSFAFRNTVFIPEIMALALQNDGDGDLVRLTFHSNFTLKNFSNLVSNSKYFASKFHNEYTADERNFTKGVLNFKGTNDFSNLEVLQAISASAKAKEGVAKYTSLAQRFARFADMNGWDKTDLKFISTHLLLNTGVQYFSMNEIKHSDGSDVDMNLMDYFLLKNFDVKERSNYAPMFFSFLESIGADNAEAFSFTGFTSKEEWLQYIEGVLAMMKDYFINNKGLDDVGYLLVGKDFVLAQENTTRFFSIKDIMESNTTYAYIIKAFLNDFNTCAKEGRDYWNNPSLAYFSTPAKENKASEEISEETVVSVDLGSDEVLDSGLVSTLDTTTESSSIPSEMINDDFSIIESSVE